MEYPIGRGNKITWQLNKSIINIIDHSYNSSPQSLVFMMNQSERLKGKNIIIFTPFRECADLENTYRYIGSHTNDKDIYWIYNPYDELINLPFQQFKTHTDIINNLKDYYGEPLLNIFIKGANTFNMINLVADLLGDIIPIESKESIYEY